MPFTDTTKLVDVIMADTERLNATPNDVLQGRNFIGGNPVIQEGRIPIIPVRTDITITGGESYTIPKGYNQSVYNVIAQPISAQTPGNATEDDLLEGKRAWRDGISLIGRMPYVGEETATLASGGYHRITKGYHNGEGIIRTYSLEYQTVASAQPSSLLVGETAWVNGVQIIGEMPNNEAVSEELNAGDSYPIPEGYHDGNGIVQAKSLEEQTDGDAVSSDFLEHKTAWVRGNQIVGSMPINPDETIMLPINGEHTIPSGYHSGLGKVTQNIPTNPGQTVTPTAEQQVLEVSGQYMTGDIIISGINGNSSIFPNTYMNDENGDPIYSSTFTSDTPGTIIRIPLFADNWHDNVSFNVYKLQIHSVVDSDTVGDRPSGELCLFINSGRYNSITNKNMTISIGFDSSTENQYIEFLSPGISEIVISVRDIYCSRPIGV